MTRVARSVGKMRGTAHINVSERNRQEWRVWRPFSISIFGQASAGGGCYRTAYGRQPIVAVGFGAAGQSKKFVL